ncbi:class I SAM-dependent methyltransferase [Vallitalea okinawensis]|uniref:class I SAM-dependent methyltransferase n=1 Tax=Vallitalea okinawensis TaxID=2078660 RepID=UPI0013003CA7|nr:class I SAM-dependent methyltransferase [Vallitalea okinawensis]
MSINKKNPYDVESHIAEIYDNIECNRDDVNLILQLLKEFNCKNILEPFCGTGRILLSLAENGFDVTGIDASHVMLNALQKKRAAQSTSIRNKVKIIVADVTEYGWAKGYDAIILGCNCLFELATLEEQEKVLTKAYNSVKSGGYIFIDSDIIENELPDYWCKLNTENSAFPSGLCEDGIELKSYSKPTFVDKKNKIWKASRRTEVYKDSKIIAEYSWKQQKHPIGYSEIMNIVANLNLSVINVWGDIIGKKPFKLGSGRATFWLKK